MTEEYDCEYCDGPDYGLTDTEAQIIVFMEHHEDDYDEIAYNGHGTGWIARRGNLLYGWINEPSVRNHYWGDKCATAADAAAVLREWVADFRATTEYPSGDDGPSIYTAVTSAAIRTTSDGCDEPHPTETVTVWHACDEDGCVDGWTV